MASDDRLKAFFEESVRSLEAQQRDFDQLRTRASYLLSAVTISTSFLGGGLVRIRPLTHLSWAAIGAFIVALGLCTWLVAMPARRWYGGFKALDAYQKYYAELHPPLSLDEFYIEIIFQTENGLAENEKRMNTRRVAIAFAAVALAAEIVLWLTDIG